ncbi:MAG: MipA/OmpV family protein [Casimicrobiaceae bacterium]
MTAGRAFKPVARAGRFLASLGTVVLVAVTPPSAAANGEVLPRWELGAGVGVLDLPDYRGAGEHHLYALPIPYVVYRGDILQVDRQKVRGLLARTERLELDVSVNGSVPVKSRSTPARSGMPDLDPTLELGPSLNVALLRASRYSLELRLPVRAVVASDFRSASDRGVLAQPNLNLDLVLDGGWKLGLLAGPLFATRRYHEYFYGVAPQYATSDRPAYAAPGGYSGGQALVAFSRRFENLWLGGFAKFDVLQGAAFEDSPLVKRKQGWAAGFGVAWIFARSTRGVAARE